MTNKMNDLSAALTALGVSVKPSVTGSDTLFAGQYGIFCTVTGNVQARNVYDKDDRFTLGSFAEDATVLAQSYVDAMDVPWHDR